MLLSDENNELRALFLQDEAMKIGDYPKIIIDATYKLLNANVMFPSNSRGRKW